jgi:hypothetical protein
MPRYFVENYYLEQNNEGVLMLEDKTEQHFIWRYKNKAYFKN